MDQELIAFLDERFRETTRQLMESFHGEVGTLHGEVGTLRGEVGTLRGEVGTLRGEVGTLHSEVGTLRKEMMGRFEQVDEAIRHTQITVEDLRSDLQGVAEGVMAANERIDALRGEMKQEIQEVRHFVHLSYTDQDNRVRPLEEWRKRIGEDPAALVRRKSGKKT